MDASEPDILSNASIEYRKLLSTPTALGPSTKYFNTYALVNAMAIYDGQRSADTSRRVFLLTRSGFAGLQKYSTAAWSGDIATRWEDMKAQIPAGLNFALSGIPYWTFDIGGFCVENRYTGKKDPRICTNGENLIHAGFSSDHSARFSAVTGNTPTGKFIIFLLPEARLMRVWSTMIS
jgi:alpha-glucosidase (family GH31 glycosyl hydrolase)